MCRHCGAIIGAGETQCAVCGVATTTPNQAHPQVDRETLRFARAVLERPYKFTIIFLIANIFVFLLMWNSNGMGSQVLWEGFSEPVLEGYGAKLNVLIDQGQWWRFVTPMFIHVNLPHLLVNMYSLWMVGPYVEKLYGSAKFVVFWVLTGIAGVVASYLTVRPNTSGGFLARFLFKTQDFPSAGASGALFGLVGVLFIFGIKFRHELPEGFKRAFGAGMLPIILINLFIGYIGRGLIDNAAHIGGLVSGALLAVAVQYRRPGERKGVAATWRVLQGAALGVVAVCFFNTVRHMQIPSVTELRRVQHAPESAAFVNYVLATNQAQEAFNQAVYSNDAANIDASIQLLDSAPTVDTRADELRPRLKDLLVRAKADVAASSQGPTQKRSSLIQDFDVWKKEYNEWLTARDVTTNH